ncbi:MAG: N-acetyl-gamma-glutamyl-phosphate reductase [Nitrospirota bacterium]|jgi:N-acetyl-gamma-glutamyl-phosphate reductase
MLKVAICGGSGYTGAELLRLLAGHPRAKVVAATSERSAGKSVAEVHGHLSRYSDLVLEPLDRESLMKRADLFFMALPHGASQAAVDFFFSGGKKVVDLSADFRLGDPLVYEEWYKVPHSFRKTLKKAVYGLPEIGHRNRIKKASLVANPGCYPTGALLGLYPVLKAGLVDASSLVVDSKSGTSGAGRKAAEAFSFCEVNETFRAYGVGTHRHTPEIEQEISALAKEQVVVNFTPHLVPIDRGILSTIYARLAKDVSQRDAEALFARAYAKEPFVRVLKGGVLPNVKHVRGTNFCEIGLKVNGRTGTLVIVTAIDNLVKGASGAAVQNMNLMMGFEETAALGAVALNP